MSPRAAWRLDAFGFSRVHDYVDGKTDWFAAGLPREGALAAFSRAGHVARTDVPTCFPEDRLSQVRKKFGEWDTCVVVNSERVVMGLVGRKELESDADAAAEDVMRLGPSTFRPNVLIEEMVHFMHKRDMDRALITNSDGRLVGVLCLEDAERVLEEAEKPR